jgi:ankyrin repeat protein
LRDIQKFGKTDYKSDRAHVEAHHDGTCQWVLNKPEYQDWINTASTTLYVVGDPGVGKTVLAKFLLKTLEQSEKSKERTIYFFCNRQNRSHTTAASILRSLIHQCVMLARSLWGTHVKPRYDGNAETLCESIGGLWEVFEAIMSDSESGDWYCVLDALDACDERERRHLLEEISQSFSKDSNLQSAKGHHMNLRVLITSRPCKGIKSKIDSLKNAVTMYFTNTQGEKINECDIVKYVEDRVANLAGYSSCRKDFIKETLVKESEGIFKYASCMINTLDNTISDNANDTLKSLPQEMNMMFEELVGGVGPDLRVLLEWVALTYRPLSMMELGAALQIKTNTSSASWSTSSNVEATRNDILLCGGALKVENGKVYLFHSKMEGLIASNWLEGKPSHKHLKIAKACLIYLSLDGLKRGPLKMTRKIDCREQYKELCKEFPFLEYAASFWYKHLREADPSVPEVWNLVHGSLDVKSKRELSFQVHQFSRSEEYIGGQSYLHILAHHDLTFLARQCLKMKETDLNAVDDKGRTALWWAVEKDHESMVSLLLDAKDTNPNLEDKEKGMSPFLVAVRNGRTRVVEDFLQVTGITWNSKDKDGRTPLSWAAGSGLEHVVKLLLTNNAICDAIDSRDNNSKQTPLLWAARKGHANVVQLLLGKAASPNATDGSEGRSALSWAAGNGHKETVEVLLEQGDTDLCSIDDQGQTAFHWAATQGHKSIASAILDELCKNSGSNWVRDSVALLTQAAERGQDAALKVLLEERDIGPDSPDPNGRTALSWAAEKGHDKIVRQLLATERVNVNSKDSQHRTPLMWTALQGRENVVKLLLEEDEIDLEATDSSRKTAVKYAAFGGYNKIIDLVRHKQAERSSAYRASV